jgi:hypothetical protein
MKALRLIAVTLLTLTLPLTAFAQSSSSSGLSALYAQLSALEQQIQSLSASTTTSTAPTTASAQTNSSLSSGECPDLARSLSLGAIGPDVAGLQTYLAQQGLFNAIATGYFGTLTEAAVAQWQENNGIVSGGTADTTGLGVVGPRTRAAMESSCAPGAGTTASRNQCLNVLPPASECPTNWQPVIDANGCTMYYQCSIALPGGSAPSSSGSTATSTNACPVVQKPTCSGTVEPFVTNSNGCVTAYQCVL